MQIDVSIQEFSPEQRKAVLEALLMPVNAATFAEELLAIHEVAAFAIARHILKTAEAAAIERMHHA